MSVFIPPVAALIAETSQNPAAGFENAVNPSNGDQFVVTDPNSSNETPNVIAGTGGTTFNVASGTEQANIWLLGEDTDTIIVGNATDAAGNPLSGAGSSFQVDSTFEGSVIANFEGAITEGATVDLETETQFGGTIADAAGGAIGDGEGQVSGEFALYFNSGAGNDQIEGTQASDFIRGGAGDDEINAGGGDDLVRVGSGSDNVTLGEGADVLYWTVDQFEGDSVNFITDFTSGEDTIAIESEVASRIDVQFVDAEGNESSKAFTVTLLNESGEVEGTTVVISGNDDFDFPSDFAFV